MHPHFLKCRISIRLFKVYLIVKLLILKPIQIQQIRSHVKYFYFALPEECCCFQSYQTRNLVDCCLTVRSSFLLSFNDVKRTSNFDKSIQFQIIRIQVCSKSAKTRLKNTSLSTFVGLILYFFNNGVNVSHPQKIQPHKKGTIQCSTVLMSALSIRMFLIFRYF